MRIAVVGASGRMGRAVIRAAVSEGTTVSCAIGATDIGADAGVLAGVGNLGVSVAQGFDGLRSAPVDVVIDFSSPSATAALVPVAEIVRAAIVTGTTGLDDNARHLLAGAACHVPVLVEPNMS